MAQWEGSDPVVVKSGEEIRFPNIWCTGCSHGKDKQYDTFAPITYYCSKRGIRVPAYHPTVDCQTYIEKGDI